ncbi:MAG: putative NADPH-dependent reductase [Frankiales bacterium]|nr:putative NADPH-dependent reductase [Frankiales bacterium]
MTSVRVLLLSGSTRTGSTNTAALRAAAASATDGVTPVLLDLLRTLPPFSPDDDRDPLPPDVARLRAEVAAADAVLVCTPEYAGALPGSFKNLLDWLVGGGEADGKPVAWLDVAAPGRGSGARAELATVLGYLGTHVVEEACVSVHVPRDALGEDGEVADPALRAELGAVVGTLAELVGQDRAGTSQTAS